MLRDEGFSSDSDEDDDDDDVSSSDEGSARRHRPPPSAPSNPLNQFFRGFSVALETGRRATPEVVPPLLIALSLD